MNVKKAGLVIAGTVAALLMASPMAFATEHQPAPDQGGKACAFNGGDAGAASEISGDSMSNAVAQSPIAGNNIANLGNCSDFLNGNLNGNLSGNTFVVPPLAP